MKTEEKLKEEIEKLKKICYSKDNEGLPECFRCKFANEGIKKNVKEEVIKEVLDKLKGIEYCDYEETKLRIQELKQKLKEKEK